MYKKNLYLVFIAICCALYGWKKLVKLPTQEFCAFCNEQILNRQKLYEDDLVLVLYTHKPILPSHFLIIPKRHIERFEMLTDEESLQISQVIKKVNKAASKVFNTSSYLIHQKNGIEVGQSVPHVHFHFIAKQSGDASTLKFLAKMIVAYLRGPISSDKMQKVTEEMKAIIM